VAAPAAKPEGAALEPRSPSLTENVMAKTSILAAETAAPPAPSAPATFEQIPLDRIDENPRNPRKHFDQAKLQELAESIRAHGVVEPILVRPKGERFEVIAGARRLRASAIAEQATIPAIVRAMDDVDALEVAVIENLQRTDVHPLEEAEGYEQLLASKERKYTVDDLAAKVGKSKAYVYARMKLLALGPEGRQAFYEDRLSASVALLVARIPSHALQAKALQRVGPDQDGDVASFREAARVIQDEFMLKLAGAPFSPDDAALVPAAGACSACPKRSGAQPELFADVQGADVCSDPDCFKSKVDATWRQRAAAAKKQGRKVLGADEAKKVFSDHHWEERPSVAYQARSEYADLDEVCHEDPKKRKWSELLGGVAGETVIAKDPKGNLRELVPLSRAKSLLKKAGHEFKEPKARSTPSRPAEREPSLAEQIEKATEAKLHELVAAAGEKKKPDIALWKLLALNFQEDFATFNRRCGITTYADDAKKQKYVAGLKEHQVRGFILELLLEAVIVDGFDEEQDALLAWCGIDRAKVEAEVKAELTPKPGVAAAVDAAKKAAKGKPTGTAAKLAKRAKKEKEAARG
jgi:ParB/RepB/Spo0J family partition protein